MPHGRHGLICTKSKLSSVTSPGKGHVKPRASINSLFQNLHAGSRHWARANKKKGMCPLRTIVRRLVGWQIFQISPVLRRQRGPNRGLTIRTRLEIPRVPLSHSTVTIVCPAPNFLAAKIAPTQFIAAEHPTNKPAEEAATFQTKAQLHSATSLRGRLRASDAVPRISNAWHVFSSVYTAR